LWVGRYSGVAVAGLFGRRGISAPNEGISAPNQKDQRRKEPQRATVAHERRSIVSARQKARTPLGQYWVRA
jgi:hypothetical protein